MLYIFIVLYDLQVEELASLSLNQPVRLFVDNNTDVAHNLRQEFVRIRASREHDRLAIVSGDAPFAVCSQLLCCSYVVLQYVVLQYVVLQYVVLQYVVLQYVVLQYVVLQYVLQYVVLQYVVLQYVVLQYVVLQYVVLQYVVFCVLKQYDRVFKEGESCGEL